MSVQNKIGFYNFVLTRETHRDQCLSNWLVRQGKAPNTVFGAWTHTNVLAELSVFRRCFTEWLWGQDNDLSVERLACKEWNSLGVKKNENYLSVTESVHFCTCFEKIRVAGSSVWAFALSPEFPIVTNLWCFFTHFVLLILWLGGAQK